MWLNRREREANPLLCRKLLECVSYFMMGDNRNHSLDARFWNEKFVPVEDMVAKARVTIFPFRNIGSLAYAAEDAGTQGAAREAAEVSAAVAGAGQ